MLQIVNVWNISENWDLTPVFQRPLFFKGYWLQQAGFTIGTPVQVEVDQGRLVITAQITQH